MIKNRIGLILLFLLNIQCLKAQIGVGEWRDHLAFSFAISVTESPTKVFVASENGIFSYDKNAYNVEKITKVNGLSDVGISTISYSNENEVLLVGYSNGNVDMVFNNETFNLSDIKREMISGSKSINHVLFIDEYAYISCGFGIVVMNTEKREIKDTYYIGNLGSYLQINQLIESNGYLYAATNEGIYIADLSNPNLVDYSNWQIINTIPNYSSPCNAIYVTDGKILVNQTNESFNDIVYLFENSTWNEFLSDYTSVREIRETQSSVLITTDQNVLRYNTDFVFQDSVSSTDITNLNPFETAYSNNTYWIAERGRGLIKFQSNNAEGIMPNAPYFNNVYAIDIKNNRVLVTAGELTPGWANSYYTGAVYSFRNEWWHTMANYAAHDYVGISIDPNNNNHFYVGAWGAGLIEYNGNDTVKTYKAHNSTLQSVIEGENYYRVKGLTIDDANNVWVTNSGVKDPISVKLASGDWVSFNYDEQISNMLVGDMIITEQNNKWVILPVGNGLFVFNNNGTIDNENDDLYKRVSVVDENGKLISNNIFAIAEDLDGDIWVGTDQGIVVYYTPENVFESSGFYAQRIVLTIGDATNFLLKTQIITSIAVDGANRKWLGTQSSGVYLVSEDGTEEINHFTAENSPLVSDNIYDIGINHETGEVFFATDKGLVSYRGSATMGSDEFRDVYVYPNPVRENYDGDITVRGLVSDVNVKITDISGNIVYETTAEGGQATWNGKNFDGKRVSTGVYLVFCSNDDGSKTYITKLLFIK